MERIELASDFLGNPATRYFSNGFKKISFRLCSEKWNDQREIERVVDIYCLESVKRNTLDKDKHHLGTIEYLALSCSLIENIIRCSLGLSEIQISRSWINKVSMKVKEPIAFETQAQARTIVRVNSTEPCENSINGFHSEVFVKINETMVKMIVDHPLGSCTQTHPFIDIEELDSNRLYTEGYKLRTHQISQIVYSTNDNICSAEVFIQNEFKGNRGIGSFYKSTLLTDIIAVTGQMAQILLYRIENKKREECNNLWLRELEIAYPYPNDQLSYQNNIRFTDYRQFYKGDDKWSCITVENTISDDKCKSYFKIAHKTKIDG